MTIPRGIDARLRRLESARPQRVTVFLVWADMAASAEQALVRLGAEGVVRPQEQVAALAWPADAGRMPASRRTDLDDLNDTELKLLCAYHEALVVQHEKEMAVSAGENIAGLDATDFYIRHLRRHGQHDELRMLKFRENHDPAETTVAVYREWTARVRAWEARYMPEQARQRGRTYADTRQ